MWGAVARAARDWHTYAGLGMLGIALSVIFIPGLEASAGWLLCCAFVTLGLIPE